MRLRCARLSRPIPHESELPNTVLECKDLYNTQLIGQQDPYVLVRVGTVQKYRTKTAEDQAKAPQWSDEIMTLCVHACATWPTLPCGPRDVVLTSSLLRSNRPTEKPKKDHNGVVPNMDDPQFVVEVCFIACFFI